MSGTKIEVTYLGKPAQLDPETRKVKRYHGQIPLLDVSKGNWKDIYAKEFRKILDKFEGIIDIRFYM